MAETSQIEETGSNFSDLASWTAVTSGLNKGHHEASQIFQTSLCLDFKGEQLDKSCGKDNFIISGLNSNRKEFHVKTPLDIDCTSSYSDTAGQTVVSPAVEGQHFPATDSNINFPSLVSDSGSDFLICVGNQLHSLARNPINLDTLSDELHYYKSLGASEILDGFRHGFPLN